MLFPGLVADLSFAPVNFEAAAALGALVGLFTHRVSNRHGQQLAAVGAIDFRFTGDGTGETDLVHQEVVKEVHGVSSLLRGVSIWNRFSRMRSAMELTCSRI